MKRRFGYAAPNEMEGLADIITRLLTGRLSSEDSALEISTLCEPIIRSSETTSTVIWHVICSAISFCGAYKEVDERLCDLIVSLMRLPTMYDASTILPSSANSAHKNFFNLFLGPDETSYVSHIRMYVPPGAL